ncbi:hypothetical protein [Actinoplanes sp. HUAS TT8]|uniref:hypothetical protein n=1 Tax=Actinoplanes sp. HUAS TT8 TaxID=3447453 RepID=UPI003F525CE6
MMSSTRPRIRAIALALVLLGAGTLLAGCGATPPIGLRKDGEALVVVLGRQCAPAYYLKKLRVNVMDDKGNVPAAPMWQIDAQDARQVSSVKIGEVPEGYQVITDNQATQTVTKRVEVTAFLGDNNYGAVFDATDLREGKIMVDGDQVSPEDFQKKYGCN